MTLTRSIAWTRVVGEGILIVVSILLAFWIDAWWQEQVEKRDSAALVRGLQADFTQSQLHLREWLRGNQRLLRAATEFLTAIRETPVDGEVQVRREWLLAAVTAPTFDPTDTSLRTAVATGQVELITDQELRNSLAVWRQQLEDTQEDELLIREIAVHQLVPLLSQQVRLGQAFEFDTMVNWFTGRKPVDLSGTYNIQVNSELEGALAEKVYYTQFVVAGLSDIGETQDRILMHLDSNLATH